MFVCLNHRVEWCDRSRALKFPLSKYPPAKPRVYLNANYAIGVTILLSLFEFNILRFQKLGKGELQEGRVEKGVV